jgi:serine/threonine-protein kinase HipA
MITKDIYVYIYLPNETEAVPAGLLSVTEDGRDTYSKFSYGTKYLANPKRIAIDAVSLPLHPPEEFITYRTEEGFKIFGGIRDASPDGWGRYILEKQNDRLELLESEYLLLAGEQRVGALAFGLDLTGPKKDSDVSKSANVQLEELFLAVEKVDNEISLSEEHRQFFVRGSSLGGARPKAVTVWKDRWWLAKFSRKDDRYNIVRSEYAVMSLAKKCGIKVPQVEIVKILNRDIFLIERFDRHGSASQRQYHRQHFNSALSMLGAHESESSKKTYEEIVEVIRRYSSNPKKDAQELFSRMIFNILVNNNDDHLRNHGFLFTGKHWDLSPLYDVVPNVQIGTERDLAIGVGVQGRKANLENALSRCNAFYFSKDEARAEIARLISIVANWKSHFMASGFSGDEAEQFSTCFMALAQKY